MSLAEAFVRMLRSGTSEFPMTSIAASFSPVAPRVTDVITMKCRTCGQVGEFVYFILGVKGGLWVWCPCGASRRLNHLRM
jgi:hypothetical protein